ncbi:putative peptidyl-prolyl cis-trans isomerase Cbf2 precursor [Aliarcobacter thereius]|uniref:Peptidylprolyl isomerase n=2 Tax=Aliarcobacter thereius TaxID=544718 RepID=A0A1C0B8A0_9BACT|nr:peptidylprolyl isomerase [Aliarcobacter thereius]OCL87694.1 putative peptidyl-prolyl cis-trans isomerase Cbf2 precursor [Aliarcobacter thereius]OCL93950.1 putative peptidyl-prolyl cis-trans isomerase Cbf2 precursor [Aliarcobacter thereius]OCL95345.1 putative peptidyl-prolyl cis-trans isomerase Cbf2 precursor [Aliarcobacter thereius LMG 24486]OCL99762.1 putative peptidyl-prolyl cis-trans isomerase Cbf2 precursor [Aliarcobacter thereius]QBF16666.1 major antigenic peptide / PpiC-type peptidyl-
MKKIVLATALFGSILFAEEYYATVNGNKITKQDISILIQDPRVNYDQLPEDMKKQILDGAINRKLLAKNALSSGVEKDSSYKEALDRIKEDLALQVWQKQKIESIAFNDKEKKEFYDKNRDKFNIPETFEASHILVEDESEAKKIIKELDKAINKENKFAELAGSKSKDGSAKNGGYLGKFASNEMVPEFSEAVKGLSKGAYTKAPVKTQFGYHIILLKDKSSARSLGYDEVKDNIENIMKSEKINKDIETLVSELRKKAKIVIK